MILLKIINAFEAGKLKAADIPLSVRTPLIAAKQAADALTAKQVWELRIAAGEPLPTWERKAAIEKAKADAAANCERIRANRIAAGKVVQ